MCYIAARVGIRELRQHLSVYVDRVKAGETLEVTEYGRPVALLGPLPRSDDLLDRLEREGRLVQRATVSIEEVGPPLPARPGEKTLSEILGELREDRF